MTRGKKITLWTVVSVGILGTGIRSCVLQPPQAGRAKGRSVAGRS